MPNSKYHSQYQHTSAISPPNQQAVCLVHVARLHEVPKHTVRLERQLSCRADNDARSAITMGPLHFVEQLHGHKSNIVLNFVTIYTKNVQYWNTG